MDGTATPLIAMGRIMPKATQEQVRARLGRFGFSQDKVNVKIGELSGGERARLNFCFITHDGPSLLILDEPTNHLDIQAREALVEALNEYKGAVVLISHDRHLVELTADHLWLVAGGKVTPWEGDLDEYQSFALGQRARGDNGSRASANGNARKDDRRSGAQRREAVSVLKKRAQDAEAKVTKLTKEKEKLDADLAKPDTYADKAKAADLTRRQGEVARRLEKAEEEWLEAQQALEEETAA
jgi:ATP-binding cassette, subfamily F, member 3